MRAAVLEKSEGEIKIYDDVQIIDPRPGEVRVRVHYCGVCHSDLSVVNGTFPMEEPVILGHEASGVVDQVGAGVTHLKPGDPVVLTPTPPCGHCYFCQRGERSLCTDTVNSMMFSALPDGETGLSRNGQRIMRGVGVGAFAEYVITPASGAVKIPEDVPLDVVCVIGCALQTGVGAVFNIAEMEEGATALVLGLGGVGQAVVQGARAAGASLIAVSDPSAERRELAKKFGATHLLDPTACDVAAECRKLTDDIGMDYSFEAAGVAGLGETALNAIRNGGVMVYVGAPPLEATMDLGSLPVFVTSQKKVCGCLLGGCDSGYEVLRLTRLWRAGSIDMEGMITARRPLEELPQAFEDMKAGRGIRTVLEIGG